MHLPVGEHGLKGVREEEVLR